MLEKIRKPAVSGQFYEGEKNRLTDGIKECFLEERGVKSLPEINKGNKNVKGVVVPHAGYVYSGAIASHSYHFIANNGFADTFILIGPNHTGMGSGVSVMTEGAWETPLGKVSINEKIAKQICTGIIDNDETAHMNEHSLEVQLPFLQFCAKDKEFDFVPICMAMQDFETAEEVGIIIADAIKDTKGNVVIVASSDFSHAGFNYSSMPPSDMKVDKFAEKQDMLAIEKILNMDPRGLINTVYANNITMCGYGPVASMLTAAKILGAKNVELLKYGTSYEVHPGSSCVGYGALVVH